MAKTHAKPRCNNNHFLYICTKLNNHNMKNLIFIIALFIISCSKKSDVTPVQKCITCTETVYYHQTGQMDQNYIASQNQYCDGIPPTIMQGTLNESGTINGVSWKRTKTMTCK